MKVEITRSKNHWYLTLHFDGKEFTFLVNREELDNDELLNFIKTLCKFEGIKTEIDFTTRH